MFTDEAIKAMAECGIVEISKGVYQSEVISNSVKLEVLATHKLEQYKPTVNCSFDLDYDFAIQIASGKKEAQDELIEIVKRMFNIEESVWVEKS